MTQPSDATGSRPTVALVHGASADAAGWDDVVAQLIGDGVSVRGISNPLRGILQALGAVSR
jgi:hypothetical protein